MRNPNLPRDYNFRDDATPKPPVLEGSFRYRIMKSHKDKDGAVIVDEIELDHTDEFLRLFGPADG